MVAGRTFREGKDILLFQPEDYILKNDRSWLYQATSVNECVDVSKKIFDICKQNDIKQAYLLSLFTEEIAINTMEHGFRKDKKILVIIKLILSEEDIMLNISDNCAFFDPMDYYEILLEKKGYESGMGIRIVMNLAEKISYTNTFSLNNLFIKMSR